MSELQRGNDAYLRGEHSDALAHYHAAYEAGESPADALVGCGCACDLLGRHDDAQAYFERALALDGRHAFAHHYRGTQLLLRGRLDEGWEEYRWYYETADFEKIRPKLPPWDGRQSGQRVLLLSDQGLGDAVQFLRYGPRLRNFFREVVFEGSTQLFRLARANLDCAALAPLNGIREVFIGGYETSDCSCYVPLSSLAGYLGAEAPEPPSPAVVPVTAELRERYAEEYCGDGAFKVAIARRGSNRTPRRTVRDIPPEMFRLLAHVPRVHFYVVNLDAREDEVERLGTRAVTGLHEPFGRLSWDLVDTAAILANMRLVITCDAVIAHLAGSMGLPVWVALPYASEWRWQTGRSDSGWYPEMRLYRQPGYRQWDPVFQEMVQDLEQLSAW